MRLILSLLLLFIHEEIHGLDNTEKFICKKAGRYENSEDDTCNSFFLCSYSLEGELIQTQYGCPEKSIFSPDTSSCHKNYTCPRISRSTRDLVQIESSNNIHYQCINDDSNSNYRCRRSGKFADLRGSSCTKYFLCSLLQNGQYIKTEYECPKGTLFDPKSQKCHLNYECPCRRRDRHSYSDRGEKREQIGWAAGFQWTDIYAKWTRLYQWTPKPDQTSTKHSTSEPTTEGFTDDCIVLERGHFFRCYKEGLFRDPKDATCTDYFLCSRRPNGEFLKTRYSCPYGSTFDPNRGKCSFHYTCPCQLETRSSYLTTLPTISTKTTTETSDTYPSPTPLDCGIPEIEFKCEKKGRYPDRRDSSCNTYFLCESNGKGGFEKLRYRCPRCLTFDPDTEKCTDNYVCPCSSTESPNVITTERSNSTSSKAGTDRTSSHSSSVRPTASSQEPSETTTKTSNTSPSSKSSTDKARTATTSGKTIATRTTSSKDVSSMTTSSETTDDCSVSPTTKPFRCSTKGRFSDRTDLTCSSYFLCSALNNGTLIKTKYRCPKKSYFDPSIHRCSKTYKCPCSTTTSSTTSTPSISPSGSDETEPTRITSSSVRPTASSQEPSKTTTKTSNTSPSSKSSTDKARTFTTSGKTKATGTTSSKDVSSTTTSSETTDDCSVSPTTKPFRCSTKGRFSDKTDLTCSSYFLCSALNNGTLIKTKYRCPKKSYFDSSIHRCSKTYKCPCSTTTSSSSISTSGSSQTEPTRITSSSVRPTSSSREPSETTTKTSNTSPSSKSSTEKARTATTSGRTKTTRTTSSKEVSSTTTSSETTDDCSVSPTTKPFRCSTKGRFPDRTDLTCSSYFLCSALNNGTLIKTKYRCPKKSYFDPSIHRCSKRYKCPCSTTTSSTTSTPSISPSGSDETEPTRITSSSVRPTASSQEPSKTTTKTSNTSPSSKSSTDKARTFTTSGKTKATGTTSSKDVSSTTTSSETTDDCSVSPTTKPFRCSTKGRFSDKTDLTCSSYFLCSALNNGTLIKTKYRCPKKSYFDPSIHRCSKKYKCPCSTTTSSTTSSSSISTSGSSQTEPTRITSSSFRPTASSQEPSETTTKTSNTSPSSKSSTDKSRTATTSGRTEATKTTTSREVSSTTTSSETTDDCSVSPTTKPFRCSTKGRFPDRTDLTCSSYFLCSALNNGTLIKTKYRCPKKSYFDPSIHRCSKAYKCPCASGSTTSTPTSLSSRTSTKTRTTVTSTTKSGRTTSNTDITEGSSASTTEQKTSSTTEGSTISDDCQIPKIPFKCISSGRFPNRKDLTCSTYYQCSKLNQNFIKTKHKCPKNSFFNPSAKRCSRSYECPCLYQSTTTEVSRAETGSTSRETTSEVTLTTSSEITRSTRNDSNSTDGKTSTESSSTSGRTKTPSTQRTSNTGSSSSKTDSSTPTQTISTRIPSGSTSKQTVTPVSTTPRPGQTSGTPSREPTEPSRVTSSSRTSQSGGSTIPDDCKPSNVPFKCKSSGRFPNKKDVTCASYILCSKNKDVYIKNKYECPENSLFDPSIQRCSRAYVCPCSKGSTTTTASSPATGRTSEKPSSEITRSTQNPSGSTKPSIMTTTKSSSSTNGKTSTESSSTSGRTKTPSTQRTSNTGSSSSKTASTTPTQTISTRIPSGSTSKQTVTPVSTTPRPGQTSGTPSREPTEPSRVTSSSKTSQSSGSTIPDDCKPSNVPFKCNSSGRFPNKKDVTCASYILCSKNKDDEYIKNKYECPENSLFDPSIKRCSRAYVCPCSKESTTTTASSPVTGRTSEKTSSEITRTTQNPSESSKPSIMTTTKSSSSTNGKTSTESSSTSGRTKTPSTQRTSNTGSSSSKTASTTPTQTISTRIPSGSTSKQTVTPLSTTPTPGETSGTPSREQTEPSRVTSSSRTSQSSGSTIPDDCRPSNVPFKCKSAGRFPDKRDLTCASYILCSKKNDDIYIKTKHECPENSLFDPRTKRCSRAYVCPCSEGSTTTTVSSPATGRTSEKTSSEITRSTQNTSGSTKPSIMTSTKSNSSTDGKTSTENSSTSGRTKTPSTQRTSNTGSSSSKTDSTTPTQTISTRIPSGSTSKETVTPVSTTSTPGQTSGTPSQEPTEPSRVTSSSRTSQSSGSTIPDDCKPSNVPFKCKSAGRFPDKTDLTCASYILCSKKNDDIYIKTKHECPENSLFDPRTKRCSRAYVCPCSEGSTTTTVSSPATGRTSEKPSSEITRSTQNPSGSTKPSIMTTTKSNSSTNGKTSTESSSTSGRTKTPSTQRTSNTGSSSSKTDSTTPTQTISTRIPSGSTSKQTVTPVSTTPRPGETSGTPSREPTETSRVTSSSRTSQSSGSTIPDDCKPSNVPFKCKSSGRFPNKKDVTCASYILCSKNKDDEYIKNKYECPGNSLFDPSIKRCSRAYVCPCSKGSTTTTASSPVTGRTSEKTSSDITRTTQNTSGNTKPSIMTTTKSNSSTAGKTSTESSSTSGRTKTPSTQRTSNTDSSSSKTASTTPTQTISTRIPSGSTSEQTVTPVSTTPRTGQTSGTPSREPTEPSRLTSSSRTSQPSSGSTTSKTQSTAEPSTTINGGSTVPDDCKPSNEPFRCRRPGRFPNKNDSSCSSYFICSEFFEEDFIQIKHECPKNFQFDPAAKKCSRSYECPCAKSTSISGSTDISSSSISSSSTSGSTLSQRTTKQSSIASSSISPRTSGTDATSPTPIASSTPNSCIIPKPNRPFRCESKGRFPDLRDLSCSSYFLCSLLNNGTLIRTSYKCPRNSFFNPENQECSKYYVCPCSITPEPTSEQPSTNSSVPHSSSSTTSASTITPSSSTLLPGNSTSASTIPQCITPPNDYKFVCKSKGRYANIQDLSCNSYYLCSLIADGTLVQAMYRCSHGLKFDPVLQNCSSSYQCPCSVSTTTSPTTLVPSLPTKTPDICQPTDHDFVCTAVGRYPKAGDVSCCTYYSCSKSDNGTIVQREFTCPEGTSFDPVFKTCSDTYRCPCHVTEPPEHFSTPSNECIIPTEDFVCTSPGRFPNMQDVSCCNYFLCSDIGNGTFIKTEYNCPMGTSFDPELKRCSSSYVCPCKITEKPGEATTVTSTTIGHMTQPPECDQSPDNPEHACTTRGRFKDSKDLSCSNYFLCSKLRNGTYIRTRYTCPRFSYFDPALGLCTTTYKCPCINTLTTSSRSTGRITKIPGTMAPWRTKKTTTTTIRPPNDCVPVYSDFSEFVCSSEGMFPNPLDSECKSYIHCVNKSAVLVKTVVNCEGNTSFDVTLKKCRENAVCRLCR